MSDEPLDLVAFAVEVDRWLLSFADGRATSEKAVLDVQVAQLLRRDDVRAMLAVALRDAPHDMFAIASRIILVLVPRTAEGSLALSLDPPLVAALALRAFQGVAPDAEQREPAHSSGRVTRRRSRRWTTAERCSPFVRRAEPGERPSIAPADLDLVDVARRPKQWHCIACGWRCADRSNDYRCGQCGAIRPFLGGSATMMRCGACQEWNPAFACFCEWCGQRLG